MHNTTDPTGSLVHRLDVADGTLAGALTVLIIAAGQWGEWSAVDWTTVGAAFTAHNQQGGRLYFPDRRQGSSERLCSWRGAHSVGQWAVLGTPFDVASYASAITAAVTFIANVVVPRLQPVV